MEVQWFILMKTIVFQGYRGLPSFSKGSFDFFSGAGVKMLISIETYITYDLSGGGGGSRPYPTSDPRMHSFNYVETHCT